MAQPEIDYAALFVATPSPYLVLGPDLLIIDVNQAYLRATGRTRNDLLGQYLFDAFPDNPRTRMPTGCLGAGGAGGAGSGSSRSAEHRAEPLRVGRPMVERARVPSMGAVPMPSGSGRLGPFDRPS
ncbi:PAS domain-containing protein [Streptomyces sp. SP17KL33]|uniref:PAS domain-containing protein n=1 Tax=unclassified Streptomyces TaxID=2593676 RepID=UPI003FCDA267